MDRSTRPPEPIEPDFAPRLGRVLGPPLAVAAAGGAAVVSSLTLGWRVEPPIGPFAVVSAATVGLVLGAHLAQWSRTTRPRVWIARACIVLVVPCSLAAALVDTIRGTTSDAAVAMLMGTAFAIALLPAVVAAVWAAGLAPRARRKSLIGACDRRAPWYATAVWLAVVAALGVVWLRLQPEGSASASELMGPRAEALHNAAVPTAVALGAVMLATIIAVLDSRAARLVEDARERHSEGSWAFSPDRAGTADGALDLGVGEGAWIEHVCHSRYREAAVERIVVIGEIAAARELVRSVHRRALVILALTGIAAEVAWFAFTTLPRPW